MCLLGMIPYLHVRELTLVLRPPGVVSSNSSPSLKEILLFLKMLLVFIVITSPSVLIVTVGFAREPSFLLAFPIPGNQIKESLFLASKTLSV